MFSKNMFNKLKKLFSKTGKIKIAGKAKAGVKKAEIKARVYRASEGKWYDLGTIATYKRGFLYNLFLKVGKIKKLIK